MSDSPSPYDLFPTKDAAKYVGVSVRTVWNYVKRGRLTGQMFGNSRVFTRDELDTVKIMRQAKLIKPGWKKGRKRNVAHR